MLSLFSSGGTRWKPPSLRSELQWYIVNDTVMGGRSSSSASGDAKGLSFSGNINTRGGGFASVRSQGDLGGFAGAQGLRVKCRGDGKRYMITCRTGSDESFSYCHDVLARGDAEVVLPFRDFIPSWRGQPMDAPRLRGEEIRSVGILLSLRSMNGAPNREFGDGPFEFILRDIAPDGAAEPRRGSGGGGGGWAELGRVVGSNDAARIEQAISLGAPAWNQGNKERTVEIYTQVCRESSDPRLKDALTHVSQFRCGTESAGWVLRCAMDEVLDPMTRSGSRALRKAIERGVPFFNQGMPVVCASIYMRAGGAHDSSTVKRALAEAKQKKDPSDAAWAMRRAFDEVLQKS